MKRILSLFLATSILLAFTACTPSTNDFIVGSNSSNYGDTNDNHNDEDCNHSYYDATCQMPKTCAYCGETVGTSLAHTFTDATCTSPKKCTICGHTEGGALGHNYTPATCDYAQTCQSCGITSGNSLGHQYVSGYCIRCNHKDPYYVEYGTVQGTVTYKYNNYIGNRGDTGATVILFPNMSNYDTKQYDNSRACLGLAGKYDSGIIVTKCDGNGNYIFDNVPAGRYYLLIVSSKTTDGGAFDNKASRESWIKGNFTTLLSDGDIEKLIVLIGYQKIYTENLDVLGNRSHTISKDFGITYI